MQRIPAGVACAALFSGEACGKGLKLQPGAAPGFIGKAGLYGFPYKADLKSRVWYVPENFADSGYKVPSVDGRIACPDDSDRPRWRHALVHRAGGGEWDILAVSAFVVTILSLAVFFALQKYLLRGLLAGSVRRG